MIIKGETTIPTGRQFENIKTSYEIDFKYYSSLDVKDYNSLHDAREDLHRMLKEDCEKLHHCLKESSRAVPMAWRDGDTCVLSGTKWYVKDGKWTYDEEEKT